MSDWELHTDSLAKMNAALNYLGFSQGDGYRGNVRYTVNIYGQKYDTQNQPLPGYYAILRWHSADPFPPPGVNIPSGVTCIPLPVDSPYQFA